jgi:predicted DNA-binding transcriptional regulator AlpA
MSEGRSPQDVDLRRLAELLADVLTERGLIDSLSAARVLDAAEVARLLGRDRQWVYGHAAELGAFRYGDSPKGRLGFDLSAIERWKADRRLAPAPRRRRPHMRGRPDLIPYDDRISPSIGGRGRAATSLPRESNGTKEQR